LIDILLKYYSNKFLNFLLSSGAKCFSKYSSNFPTVIIDEAAQAVELSTLIPLKYFCKRCILVGDPQQLPATVISKVYQ
jgi:senataxin